MAHQLEARVGHQVGDVGPPTGEEIVDAPRAPQPALTEAAMNPAAGHQDAEERWFSAHAAAGAAVCSTTIVLVRQVFERSRTRRHRPPQYARIEAGRLHGKSGSRPISHARTGSAFATPRSHRPSMASHNPRTHPSG